MDLASRNNPVLALPQLQYGYDAGVPNSLYRSMSAPLLNSYESHINKMPVSLGAREMDRSKTNTIVEVMSAIIVILTVVGLVVGIVFPGIITGAIFPLALILWFILYMAINQNN